MNDVQSEKLLSRKVKASSTSSLPYALRQAPSTLTGSLRDYSARRGPASPLCTARSASYSAELTQARASSRSAMSSACSWPSGLHRPDSGVCSEHGRTVRIRCNPRDRGDLLTRGAVRATAVCVLWHALAECRVPCGLIDLELSVEGVKEHPRNQLPHDQNSIVPGRLATVHARPTCLSRAAAHARPRPPWPVARASDATTARKPSVPGQL